MSTSSFPHGGTAPQSASSLLHGTERASPLPEASLPHGTEQTAQPPEPHKAKPRPGRRGKKRQSVFTAQYARLFEAAACRTQVELAGVLEIRQSSVSDAKRRKTLPADWLLKLLRQKCVNPEWILTGQGARFLLPWDDSAPTQCSGQASLIAHGCPFEQCPAQNIATELVNRILAEVRAGREPAVL